MAAEDPIRRRLLRNIGLAAAGLAAASATQGAGGVLPLPPALPEPDGVSPIAERRVRYAGAKAVAGPAPRGLPLLPLRVGEFGYLEVAPTAWERYRYCGSERAPGLRSDYKGDSYLRFHLDEAARLQGANPWYSRRVGDRIHQDDLVPGGDRSSAKFRFRSEGEEGINVLQGVLFAVPHDRLEFTSEAAEEMARDALQVPNLVAYYAACTHFCCTVGHQEDPTAKAVNAWDLLFCSCHLARFDPRVVHADHGLISGAWEP
ncbi:MAG TPA: hypothetical protein VNZ52_15250 [Candidatus Thermoplasmatota archaeon]|nr:hypothetical protein [Candidatus Thermoplasmatota archaeon]